MKKNKKVESTAYRAAQYGVLVALALVLSWLEAQIPAFFALPGMKLGLTNIVVLLALYKMGNAPAAGINVLRIVLVSMLFGGFSAFIYSISGGMLSAAVMILLKKTGKFSIVPVSIAGGISHNVGQILAAMFMLSTPMLGWYLAVLWVSGFASGALIGITGGELVKRLPEKLFERDK